MAGKRKAGSGKNLSPPKRTNAEKIEAFVANLASQMVRLMENCGEWQKTWVGPQAGLPYNALTGRRYTGSNVMVLMITGWAMGYTDPRWMTIPQLRTIAEQHKIDRLFVRAGEKAAHILYPNRSWFLDEDGEKRKITEKEAKDIIARNGGAIPGNLSTHIWFSDYAVFNAQQIPGFPDMVDREKREFTESDRNRLIDSFVEYTRIPVQYGFFNPVYNFDKDTVFLPKPENFNSVDEFYSAELHELFHATGHTSRENRNLTGDQKSREYSFEEMRAELFSVIAGCHFNIPIPMENAAAYIKTWNRTFSGGDASEVFNAARDAVKVFQYMVDFSEGRRPTAAWLPDLPDALEAQEAPEDEENFSPRM